MMLIDLPYMVVIKYGVQNTPPQGTFRREMLELVMMMMSENQSRCFGLLRVKRQKASLNRRPRAYTCGGVGLGSHLTPVM
jgi:hypothetical protein